MPRMPNQARIEVKGMERKDGLVVATVESQGAIKHPHKTEPAQADAENPPEPSRRGAGLGRRNVGEGEDRGEEHRVAPQLGRPARGVIRGGFAIHHQDSDGEQRERAQDDVAVDFPDRLALVQTFAQRKRDGHADDEQKPRKHQIHEGHAAAVLVAVAEMDHPVRHDFLRRTGQIVHEDHRTHHKSGAGRRWKRCGPFWVRRLPVR